MGHPSSSIWTIRFWRQVAGRAAAEFRADQVSIISSGVAFRATLAIFPGIAVLVWISSLFISSSALHSAMLSVTATIPDSTREIINRAMNSQLARNPGAESPLGFLGPLLSLLFATWSANSGVKAMFIALNTIFDQTEKRSLLRLTMTTLMFTCGALIVLLLVIGLIVASPIVLTLTGIPQGWLTVWVYIRWPLLLGISMIAIGLLYRYAPNRKHERWSVVTWGAFSAALALTGSSAAFTWAVGHFASLSITYGSLSTVVAFMIWLWLSATLVLAGAEIDAAVEREMQGNSNRVSRTQSPEASSSKGAAT